MSAGRYRMALEAILELSPYSDGGTMQKIARRALVGARAKTAAPIVAEIGVRHGTHTVPLVSWPSAKVDQEPTDDEPEPIDLTAIDAELDAEPGDPEPPVVQADIDHPRQWPNPVFALREVMDAKVAQIGTRGKGPCGGSKPGRGEADRRAEVLACIREGAGLDEQEITLQLGMHREHVAEATGQLLEAGQVVLHPDGTYVTTEEAAA